jgi:integrative and conjugative element protein (TIGR02256 family)
LVAVRLHVPPIEDQEILWITWNCFEEMVAEAELYSPRETGGALMGYWSGRETVIRALVLGGPRARRSKTGFAPDSSWQQPRIAETYERSGRVDTFLGDWHSHPDGGQIPSWKDIRNLRRIAERSEARAPEPVMLLASNSKESWRVHAWRWTGRATTLCWLRIAEGRGQSRPRGPR